MRYLFQTVLASVVFFSGLNAYCGPEFLDFRENATQYTSGESAVLSTYIRIQPKDIENELVLVSTLDGTDLEVMQLSKDLGVSITDPLPSGMHSWTVKAYIQNVKTGKKLQTSILHYRQLNDEIEQNLQVETDSSVVASLQAEKSQNLNYITLLNTQVWKERVKVAEQSYTFNVLDSVRLRPFSTSLLQIEPANPLSSFAVSDHAIFYLTLTTDFSNADGPLEPRVLCSTNESPVPSVIEFSNKRLDGRYFSCTSRELISSDLGTWNLLANVEVRSEKKASAIKSALLAANQRKTDYLALSNLSNDPLVTSYYQELASRMSLAITALETRLSGLWMVLGETQQTQFVVFPLVRTK